MILPSVGDPDVFIVEDNARGKDATERFPRSVIRWLIEIFGDNGLRTCGDEGERRFGIKCIGSHDIMRDRFSTGLGRWDIIPGVKKADVIVAVDDGLGASA